MKRKELLFLVLITLFGALLRLVLLDRIPNAIGGDELNYVLTAKALFLNGTDLTGTWNPLSFLISKYPPGPSQAELPYLLFIPIVGSFPLSLLASHVTSALFSITVIPLMFFIGKKLIGTKTGLFAAFLTAINPWNIHIGRTAYEAPIVVFFFLAALCVLLYAKSWKLLFTIPLFFCAFYSYIGTKLIFLPFVFITVWYSYAVVNKKKFKKAYAAIIISCTLLVVFFGYFLLTAEGTRTGEILLPNSPDISSQVDSLRRTSIANPVTQLFENKPMLFMRILAVKLYNSFSINFLFVSGDQFFGILRHGLFYMVDLIFIVVGLIALFVKKRKVFYLLTVLILLGTLPQLFHTASTNDFSYHLILMFPFLIIAGAYGITVTLERFKMRPVTFTVIALYLVFAANFLQIYFFQAPLQGQFDFSLRPLARYAALAAEKNPVIIHTNGADSIAQKYLFYSNGVNKKMFPFKKNAQGTFRMGNVLVTDCTPQDLIKDTATHIYDVSCKFVSKTNHLSITQLKDGGETFAIYNDKVCNTFPLNSYPQNITMRDFLIEQLPAKDFCTTYIAKQIQQ